MKQWIGHTLPGGASAMISGYTWTLALTILDGKERQNRHQYG
jgi:hypothetical protein